ncbi:hypothetical protein RN001_015067 [Aquatica leii]|uniref:Cytochrome P450 n=1 Tax=Aquatica leii TaxID=1421715 RepID=A0AAN7P1B6_9COLE|nr:hypothetical protein RN001_015067 [Aquatica leii]
MSFFSVLFATVLISVVSVWIYFKWKLNYWKRRGVHSLPTVVPLGNAFNMITQKESMGEHIMHFYNEFKKKGVPYGGYYFFNRPIFIPVDLELCKRIMITDFEYFQNHSMYLEKNNPLSGNIYALRSQEWKTMRNKLSPAFTVSKNKMMFPTITKSIDNLLDIIDELVQKNELFDMYDYVANMGLDVILSCAFGLDANVLKNPNSDLRKHAMGYFYPSFRDSTMHLLGFLYPWILDFLHLSIVRQEITDFFFNLTKNTVEYREKNRIIRPDFMHLLLQIKNNAKISEDNIGSFEKFGTNDALTMEELTAQSIIFMVGGYETSSATSTYLLYEFAHNEELQEKARQEVLKALSDSNEELTYDLVKQLPYLQMCVDETLRKYPIGPVIMRDCNKDYKVPNSNVVIKKGTYVFISALGIQRDAEYYPDPDKFDPERFSEENLKKRSSTAYMPFGLGPRICIAYTFGTMQVKITVAKFLARYKFKLNPKTEYPLKISPHSFPILPRNNVWLDLQKL